jgi:hypothetical protein
MSDEEAVHAVKIAADLYRARDAARVLFGDEYEVLLRPFRRLVREMARDERRNVLEIPTLIDGRARDRGDPPLSDTTVLTLLAAAVDEAEANHVQR